MNKPTVFNYGEYERLKEKYEVLLKDFDELQAENEKLKKDKGNLEIRCRIAETNALELVKGMATDENGFKSIGQAWNNEQGKW